MKKTFSILIILAIIISSSIYFSQTVRAETYTISQVQTHNTNSDCWTIINNKVYNLTSFISQHPGGASAIASLCGTDGTTAFSNMHSGNVSANNELTNYYIGDVVVEDITIPTAPSNLSANAVSTSQINLNWTASTDNVGVAGYDVYRDNTKIASTINTNFINYGLSASTTYSYFVKAYDDAGNISTSSASVLATTFATSTDQTAPTAPSNLSANAVSTSQINLSWTASTDNVGVVGYAVFRNNNQIATTTTNNLANIGLSASTTYSYYVKAYDANGNMSSASNIISVTTLSNTNNPLPSAPSNLSAKLVSYKHINLIWKAPTDNSQVSGYAIYKDGVQIATVKQNHYNSIGLSASTTYSYYVKAYDANGNMSGASNIISVTTLSNSHRNDERDDDCDKNLYEHEYEHEYQGKHENEHKYDISNILKTKTKKEKHSSGEKSHDD